MVEKNNTKKLVIAGVLLAMGILIPMIFHTLGIAGTIFLPMHIPVLIGGFLLPPYLALLLGLITPLLNSFLTGMPPLFPMAIIMTFELAFYGLIASLMYRKFHLPSLLSLIISMIVGRVVAGIVVFILVSFLGIEMNPIMFVKGGILTGFPGIVIQLILIPSLIYGIVRYTTINFD